MFHLNQHSSPFLLRSFPSDPLKKIDISIQTLLQGEYSTDIMEKNTL